MSIPIDMQNFTYNTPQTMLLCHCNKCNKDFCLLPTMEKRCPYCTIATPIKKVDDKRFDILFSKIKKLEKKINALGNKINKSINKF